MAYTLLEAVNAVLKEVKVIQGSSGEISAFTGNSFDPDVATCIRAWNDALDEVYRAGELPGEVATSTFTLSTSGTDSGREYSLASDFVAMAGNPKDTTNNRILYPYPTGYYGMREDRLDPDDFTGRPSYWVISPVNGNIRIDTTPDENGDVYTYDYEKSRYLDTITDTFPFNDDAVDALTQAVAEVWKMRRNATFSAEDYQMSISRAMRMVKGSQPVKTYGVRRSTGIESWPI